MEKTRKGSIPWGTITQMKAQSNQQTVENVWGVKTVFEPGIFSMSPGCTKHTVCTYSHKKPSILFEKLKSTLSAPDCTNSSLSYLLLLHYNVRELVSLLGSSTLRMSWNGVIYS